MGFRTVPALAIMSAFLGATAARGDTAVTPSHALAGTHECSSYYPPLAQLLNQSGAVRVSYDVAADGAIGHVAIQQSSGVKRLDDAAMACVSQHWRNTPAMKDGVAIASPGHQAIIQFVLHEPDSTLQPLASGSAAPRGTNPPTDDTSTSDIAETLLWIFGPLAIVAWLVRGSRLWVFRRRDCPSCDARNRSLQPFALPGYCSSCGSKFAPPA